MYGVGWLWEIVKYNQITRLAYFFSNLVNKSSDQPFYLCHDECLEILDIKLLYSSITGNIYRVRWYLALIAVSVILSGYFLTSK